MKENLAARRFVRWFWANLLGITGCLWWARRKLQESSPVLVLALHRVLRETDRRKSCSLPGMIVRETTFRRFTLYLKRYYAPVDVECASPGLPSRKLRIALTFDDGWDDNYHVALPIASMSGVPLTIFVCTGLVGRSMPFWPERVVATWRARPAGAGNTDLEALVESLKQRTPLDRERFVSWLRQEKGRDAARDEVSSIDRTLTWRTILNMNRSGVRFGSHTHTHQILSAAPEDQIRCEVRNSKAILQTTLGKPCDLFAYPNGEPSPEARRILENEGFRLAFTLKTGIWTADSDPLAIPRMNVCEEKLVNPWGQFSPAMFGYCIIWKTWRATRAPRGGKSASGSRQYNRLQPRASNESFQAAAGLFERIP